MGSDDNTIRSENTSLRKRISLFVIIFIAIYFIIKIFFTIDPIHFLRITTMSNFFNFLSVRSGGHPRPSSLTYMYVTKYDPSRSSF